MSLLLSELVFLILQFLGEEKFKETVHRLEQESGLYFNTRNFEEMVTNGEWDELEKYCQQYLAALAKYMESAQQFPSLKNSRLRTQINQRSSRISGPYIWLLAITQPLINIPGIYSKTSCKSSRRKSWL
uniref:TPL/SMU1 LisH-like dimerisation domain-containing protein n=1 Tax=Salix viminalis TaxID=40686 RepID=A0A6N2N0C2_SALVM